MKIVHNIEPIILNLKKYGLLQYNMKCHHLNHDISNCYISPMNLDPLD